MRLLELEPRWIHPNLFIFKCPHCREVLLTCKNAVMDHREQHELFDKTFREGWPLLIVGTKVEQCWNISGDFANMSVTPSIDASASGHWHGCITNGEAQ